MSDSRKMPVVFIGHGSPMNAIETNEFSTNWRALAKTIPTPKAIVCVSAHWLIEGTAVTAMAKPKTIHDFYGFPDELYAVRYPAPGSTEYARLVQKTIESVAVAADREWGLDHGTWSVLLHMYPAANIPVLQLSLNYNLSFERQYQIGVELKKLREQGVLIIGSGNLVHNLMLMNFDAAPYPWAVAFDAFVKECLEKKDHQALINAPEQENFRVAHPTYEHYLPLLYVLGASDLEEPRFINESLYAGSLSMRCVIFGSRQR